MSDVAGLRREYSDRGLSEGDLAADPMTMFAGWFEEARAAGLYEPNAMVVATVSADPSGGGQPSSRMVLLKGFSDAGFVFFTNQASRKGHDLAGEPRCALLFPWHPLERQVRVEGVATPVSRADVTAYFSSRPRGSRLGAHASHQSRVTTREELDAAYAAAEAAYPDEVPVPEEWGGYLVRPEVVEFWQGRPGRMHDRLVYLREDSADGGSDEDEGGWRVERLAP
jgi:pyridoxamine 5'-phosphate oxidase